jgi:hypothetical protein
MIYNKKCIVCGVKYTSMRRHSVFCSPVCNARHRYKTNRRTELARTKKYYHDTKYIKYKLFYRLPQKDNLKPSDNSDNAL